MMLKTVEFYIMTISGDYKVEYKAKTEAGAIDMVKIDIDENLNSYFDLVNEYEQEVHLKTSSIIGFYIDRNTEEAY